MKLWRRKPKQCKAKLVEQFDGRSITEYCTRTKHSDPYHANAFSQIAWVVLPKVGKQITYRYPYEHLRDDTTIEVRGVQNPEYFTNQHKEKK